ncbi:polysaccharide lyase 6 family protein [Mucilaginibacter boryungensis]|uniref:Polysaccharide lyase 6 family protein n=1 Tax=Mucilaginibacter boryungensis TaxID=768480 RepID=A0ABR9XBM6_9SPHI|nr:polysaccharide lyase 6 family protein [Mucilaginibacter boryungensis]MBE9664733.1 polysaccharide lyase 6 family protein [Mucilaginibacter boryungensis]
MFKLNTPKVLFLLLCSISSYAKDYPVHNAAELAFLNLKPGDRAIMQPGNWTNQQLVFKAKGTKEAPVTLISSDPGKIIINGNSHLLIDGQWLVVDGLNFSQGNSQKKDVITFSKDAEWCRLTNTSIVDFNPADKKQDYKWVSINGYHNRVDHCYIKGKTHQGTTLVVWVADKPNYHEIDHNFFDTRPDLGNNGGETIRIGTSTVSMNDSYTTVEDNVFYQCNGEMEVLSNKSGHNTIRNNLFYECVGTLTLREGNFAEVYGNYMIGNGVKGTGGIRIIGESHKVYYNYLQGLTGTGLKAAITIMDAIPNSELKGYMQVKNAEIKNNTIINCTEAFEVGSGKRDGRGLPPQNVTITNNLVLASDPIVYTDQPQGLKISGNILFNIKLAGDLPDGFDMKDPRLNTDATNIYQPSKRSKIGAPGLSAGQKLLFDAAGIGPAWYKNLPAIRVK